MTKNNAVKSVICDCISHRSTFNYNLLVNQFNLTEFYVMVIEV